jgi:hypothetical protein
MDQTRCAMVDDQEKVRNRLTQVGKITHGRAGASHNGGEDGVV